MAPADDVDGAAKASPLFAKYGTRVDAQSARELLAARLAKPAAARRPRKPRPTSRKHKEAAEAAGGGAEAIGRLPEVAPGQGAPAPGRARRVRHAEEEAVTDDLRVKAGTGASAPRRPIPPFSEEHEEFRQVVRRFVADRAGAAGPGVGGRALVPQRRLHAAGRAGLPRPEVRGALRRPGRRLPGRRRVHRGARALRLGRAGRGHRRAYPRSPCRRSGSSAPRTRSSATSSPAIRGEKIARAGHHRARRRLRRRGHQDHAKRVDGGWVVNGSKMYITNGVRADFIVTAVEDDAGGRPPGACRS